MSPAPASVGIIGSGKLGTTLARLFADAGVDTRVASRTPPDDLQFVLDLLAPGAHGASIDDAIADSDAVVLALPFGAVPQLAHRVTSVTLVIDATNYWAATDGSLPAFASGRTMSESVAAALPGTTVVKGFNHLGYHDLDSLAHAPNPVALAVAADDAAAAGLVAALVRASGFEPVVLPTLAHGAVLEVGQPVFGRPLPAAELARITGAQIAAEVAA